MERKVVCLLSYLSISGKFLSYFNFLKEGLDARLLSRSLRQRSDKPLVGHYCGGRVWSICLPFVFTLYLYLFFFVFCICICILQLLLLKSLFNFWLFWLCCHLLFANFVFCICICIFLYFAFVFVFCLCCYCRVWSICFRLFSLVFRLINFTRTTAAVIMSPTSHKKMFKASKPQIPQFVWKGEGRGAKVWSILLLDTFLKFSPNQPTLDSVDSAGKRQAP